MASHTSDTIVARATAEAISALGIVRVSGSKSARIAQKLFSSASELVKQPRTMIYGELRNGKEIIDTGLAVYFAGPNSYTGEDTLELHLHGNPIIIEQVIALAQRHGARLAEPGEFTRRAYLAGKLDLAQAESVNDVIVSQSASAVRLAESQLKGSLSQKIVELRGELVGLSASLSANLDFSEEDLDNIDGREVKRKLDNLEQQIGEWIKQGHRAQKLHRGITAAIVGKPNVGKSSLLNALIGEEKAIVTEVAGTTRDSIEVELFLSEAILKLIDTAGLRETQDRVEGIGVERAEQVMEQADIVLVISDTQQHLDEIVKQYPEIEQKANIGIQTKIDQNDADLVWPSWISANVKTSAHSLAGLEDVLTAISGLIKTHDFSDSLVTATNRHLEALNTAQKSLQRAIKSIKNDSPYDLIVTDITEAAESLDSILGIDVSQQTIDAIFQNFCIGK